MVHAGELILDETLPAPTTVVGIADVGNSPSLICTCDCPTEPFRCDRLADTAFAENAHHYDAQRNALTEGLAELDRLIESDDWTLARAEAAKDTTDEATRVQIAASA